MWYRCLTLYCELHWASSNWLQLGGKRTRWLGTDLVNCFPEFWTSFLRIYTLLTEFWHGLYSSYVTHRLLACLSLSSSAGAFLRSSYLFSLLVGSICWLWGIIIAIFSWSPFSISIDRYYLATSRELKRLDSVSRSPIFAWFSESLGGTSIIRAFNQQSIFIMNNQRRLDRNQICYLPGIYVNRWLAIRLEFVGAMIIFIVALLAIFAVRSSGVDAGLVGLVISYALNTTSSLVRD